MLPPYAIVVSAKTRLKEVFHIGTMWSLLLAIMSDEYCLQKWNLKTNASVEDLASISYVFATADMIPETGERTQGADVGRTEVRNLIAMDAAFFDYVFVAKPKQGYVHIADSLDMEQGREALFHQLGCLLDLIEQKFGPIGFSYR